MVTRFWCRPLVSVKTMQPTDDAATAWLAEDFSTRNGHGLWLDALDGMTQALVRRAVTRLVLGKDRMSADVHRKDFADVDIAEEFRRKACAQLLLQFI